MDWKTVIRETMQGVSVVDYTYQRSHKNMGHLLESDDIFMPDFHREDTGELVLAFDTSASCSPDEVQQLSLSSGLSVKSYDQPVSISFSAAQG